MKEKYKSCQAYAIDNIIIVADSIEQAIELYHSYVGEEVEIDSIQNLVTPSKYRNAIRPKDTCTVDELKSKISDLREVSEGQRLCLTALLDQRDTFVELKHSLSELQKHLSICCKEASCP